MKKITFGLLAVLFTTFFYGQTVTQSMVTALEFTGLDENNKPTGETSNPSPLTVTLTGLAPNTEIKVYNQLRDASNPDESSNQVAGAVVTIMTDGDGNGTGNVNWAYWPPSPVKPDGGDVIWYTQASGAADISQTITYTANTLSTPELMALKQARVFPNPTTGLVHIEKTQFNIDHIEVYNVLGSQVGTSTDLSTLENGVYFLKIFTNHASVTKRIIKK
ncbi:T9SS type A sorting domain-containing protein [Tamlana fucoidanivorans]|uniref:T9SS type A sorting domain-containing protein n=1 Tax=Allotamlana fucoidanivorans TaxID=2583814 RepID=A0A5C4SFC2_9FLAO|nr:T9SS type A sorting domain-containing protein [Tamlana fucoidanivorans]TNJ42178.1 T9SS type A sorting domain-containing protein [Tamlana fucoidanivorans]